MITDRQTPAPPLLWTPRQAAAALQISERSLWSRTQPRGPIPCLYLGPRLPRYDPCAVSAWISGQSVDRPNADGPEATHTKGDCHAET